ncbi:MAG: hypothetical protein ACI9N1_000503 [Flavobacteriales bacterium]|jgi:hypothetical protein
MKNILLIALISVSTITMGFIVADSVPVVEDNYKVIKVDGKITFVKSGKNLITGDLFTSNEKLTFASNDSRAAVISKLKGRFVLTPDTKGGKAANLMPAMSNVSTRSGALITALDLKNHFSQNYLVLDALELKLNEDSYPMDSDNFFYLQYELNGENIPKKLNFKAGNILEITASEIYTVDGKQLPIPEKTAMSIYYRNSADKKSTKVSDFNLVVPNTENLKQELKIITSEIKDQTQDNLTDEITAYLHEFYGTPQKENVSFWLKDNMNFK